MRDTGAVSEGNKAEPFNILVALEVTNQAAGREKSESCAVGGPGYGVALYFFFNLKTTSFHERDQGCIQ